MCLCTLAHMDKTLKRKRLIVQLTEAEHVALVREARGLNLTIANFVRKVLSQGCVTEFGLERQGVKRKPQPKRKLADLLNLEEVESRKGA